MSINITLSLNTIYEFIDRGMKGMLTGDITSNLIINMKKIFEKYLKDIKEMEEDIVNLGINTNDFYNIFFKIDEKFLNSNTAKNISLNLSKHFEYQGIHTKKLLYYVNLKQTQFYDPHSEKVIYNTQDEVSKEDFQSSVNLINNKKKYFHCILNDMYNEILETIVVNKLKTPFYGVKYAEKENVHNLFRRQLFIEEGCFDSANEDFTKIFSSLQRYI